jgi:hypothetical protein
MTVKNISGSRWAHALRGIGAGGTAAVLAACGGGGGGGSADGTLRVALTDAPSCYEHVFVTVEKVRVHKSGGAADSDAGWSEIILSPPRKIDLPTLTNGVLEELGTTALPAGQYSQVRLVLASNSGTGTATMANSVQPFGGALTALDTPSGQQSGLKMQVHFEVVAGQTVDLVLDFDACKSVVKAGNSGKFILKPVVSVFARAVTSLQGFVTTTLSLSSTTVAAQQNGVTVRSTVPDSTGKLYSGAAPEDVCSPRRSDWGLERRPRARSAGSGWLASSGLLRSLRDEPGPFHQSEQRCASHSSGRLLLPPTPREARP